MSAEDRVDVQAERDEMRDLMQTTTVEVAYDEQNLAGLVNDIRIAHKELDDYKNGSLTLANALEERKMQAQDAGDEQLVGLLSDLKESAFGVYLRLQRGDLELLGERDGKHSGYFADDEE